MTPKEIAERDGAIADALAQGAKAFKDGLKQDCPYGPEVCADYYLAWHEGYCTAQAEYDISF